MVRMTHQLFSYGTLRQPEVQESLFGQQVPTVADALAGYRCDWITITDPRVIAMSGSDRHPMVRAGSPDDRVIGAALELNDEQLAAADAYEVDDYVRTRVTLVSGIQAWVYLAHC